MTTIVGTPEPDSVDCANYTIWGHMDPNNSSQPNEFLAYIYQDVSAVPNPADAVVVTDFDYDGIPNPPTFVLRNVAGDPNLTGDVRAYVIADYGTTSTSSSKPLSCSGSGSGNAALLARQKDEVTPQQVSDTAPLECTIDVTGFGPSVLTAFNRVWKLAHRAGMSGLSWDNGGDGSREPRVELATERPFGTPWQLTFRLGEIVVSYSKSAEEWRALAANTFRSVNSTGVEDDATLPASITVVPA